MGDWMISRKRYYGLSLPFYLTDDNQLFVVGSLEELKQLAVEPHLVDQLPSLHRPWIDQIKIKHPQTGEIMDRITDVGDCWLDAGVTPFSTLNYLTDKKYWQSWFPADLVCEMIEQVRLWYYSMLVYGVVFEQQIPYKTVLNYYEVRDEKGERMSKTKGNGIPFDQAVENMTADAMRWLYCKSKSYSVLNFGYNLTDQVKRGFISTYWNCYKYFIYLANNTSKKLKTTPPQLIDRWLISKLHRTIAKVTICLDKFDTSLTTETIESFITDLSTWYIRRCRNRQDNLVYLQQAIEVTNLLIAPIMPYISEAIYQNLSGNNFSTPTSVHHQQWPQANPQLIDDKLEKDMELVRLVCQLGHAQRQLHQIKIKQPLAKMSVYTQIPQLSPQFLSLIAEETNVKKVDWQKQDQTDISVSLDLNITEELRQEGEFRDICRQIQLMRKDQGLLPSDKIKLYSPTWPNQFEQQILKKTNAISIVKSNQLKLEKV